MDSPWVVFALKFIPQLNKAQVPNLKLLVWFHISIRETGYVWKRDGSLDKNSTQQVGNNAKLPISARQRKASSAVLSSPFVEKMLSSSERN